jgi:hypothetical protein
MNKLLETVKDYYANTLIVQYNRKPKADATVRKLVDLVYANMILTQILNGFTLESVSYQIYNTKTVGTDITGIHNVVINRFTFGNKVKNVGGFYKFYFNGSEWLLNGENVNLNDYGIRHKDTAIEGDTICVTYTPYTAKGKQLDIIGQWVGVTKNYNINLITKPLLAYPQYQRLEAGTTSDLQGGYSTYATFDTLEGGQLRYSDLQSANNELSQQSYRIIIALKIIYNNINHIAGEIDEAIYNLFGGDVITIWTDHTLTYQYPPSYAEIMGVAEYKKVLPAPIGTKIELQQIGV